MSNHNYSQYSKKNNENVDAVNPVSVTEPEVVAGPAVVTIPEVKMEPEVSAPATVTGIVANCAKLNVRVNPDTSASVVCVLEAAAEVEIDPIESTKEWFKVTTSTGVNGYCMRKFVNANL